MGKEFKKSEEDRWLNQGNAGEALVDLQPLWDMSLDVERTQIIISGWNNVADKIIVEVKPT